MAIPAAVYSLLMFFTAAAFSMWLNRSDEGRGPAADGPGPGAATRPS